MPQKMRRESLNDHRNCLTMHIIKALSRYTQHASVRNRNIFRTQQLVHCTTCYVKLKNLNKPNIFFFSSQKLHPVARELLAAAIRLRRMDANASARLCR